jgi:hypothetical protein
MHATFIRRILGIDKRTLEYHSTRYETLGTALGRNGHLSILGDERCKDLVRQTEAASHRGIPWTITEILQFFQERAAEAVNWNNVYHWLHRQPRIKSCRGVPMEDRRFEITPEVIANDFQRAIDMIDGLPAHFPSDAAEVWHHNL